MRGENNLSRGQLKGYLFEIVIRELLQRNSFFQLNVASEPQERVRMNREGFIEMKGRGCWHQIDCPCDYSGFIPFSYPIRLLGEVKFYKTALEKKHIREYIGVLKDIQENYFVDDNMNIQDYYPRKMEIGVYFSANGFQAEAEKLAYAHGIKAVSYANNFLINRIKALIAELEENYLSVKCMNHEVWHAYRQEFSRVIHDGQVIATNVREQYCMDGYIEVLNNIHNSLFTIRSSFIATTATGVFIHFVGEDCFPQEVFSLSDEGSCRVYYNHDNYRRRYFWLELSDDSERRKFYFTPPESLDMASVYGGEIVLNEKARLFRTLSVNIKLNGITRNLILHLDTDWLDAIRELY